MEVHGKCLNGGFENWGRRSGIWCSLTSPVTCCIMYNICTCIMFAGKSLFWPSSLTSMIKSKSGRPELAKVELMRAIIHHWGNHEAKLLQSTAVTWHQSRDRATRRTSYTTVQRWGVQHLSSSNKHCLVSSNSTHYSVARAAIHQHLSCGQANSSGMQGSTSVAVLALLQQLLDRTMWHCTLQFTKSLAC